MELPTPLANQLAAGAPGSIELGGTLYTVAQPTQTEMTAFALEARKLAKRRRNEKLLELFREFKDLAAAKELTGAMFPAEDDDQANLMASVTDPDCTRFIAFLLLHKADPSVTMDQLKTLITDENAPIVGVQLLTECGLGTADPNSVGATGSPSSAPATTTTANGSASSPATSSIPPG